MDSCTAYGPDWDDWAEALELAAEWDAAERDASASSEGTAADRGLSPPGC